MTPEQREYAYVALGWIGVSIFCVLAWAVSITSCTMAVRLLAGP